jgi:hypothetical protein
VFGHAYADQGAVLLRLVLLGCAPRLLTTLVLALSVARGRGWTAGVLEAASATSVVGVAALVPGGALAQIGTGFLAAQLVVAACAAGVLLRFRRTATNHKEPCS